MNQNRFKFRAWDGSQMHYQFTVAGAEFCDCLQIMTDEQFANRYYKLSEWKVMQCLGIKDVNHLLIFEGDIVEINLESKHTLEDYKSPQYIVIFKNNKFTLEYYGGDKDSSTAHFLFDFYAYKNVKIIGNIYEGIQN